MATCHKPVLLEEVLTYLRPQSGDKIIDCTFGGGGHTRALSQRVGERGKILALDCDPQVKKRFCSSTPLPANLVLVTANFSQVKEVAQEKGFFPAQGILADLGFSSDQIEEAERGFSFLKDGPLDMRYNPQQSLTAAKVLNEWPLEKLEKIFQEYGEEKQAARLANLICQRRREKPWQRTGELADFISQWKRRRGKIHPATKIFQALRIAVNKEWENLEKFLPDACQTLAKGGRLAVITFHSGEDRIVKNFFRQQANFHAYRKGDRPSGPPTIKLVNKKVIRPSWDEIKKNPRARSAKLRIIEKL